MDGAGIDGAPRVVARLRPGQRHRLRRRRRGRLLRAGRDRRQRRPRRMRLRRRQRRGGGAQPDLAEVAQPTGSRCSRPAWSSPTARTWCGRRWRSTSATCGAAWRSCRRWSRSSGRRPHYPDFLRRLARTATDIELPLGFRERLQVDDDGAIDVKHGAIVPDLQPGPLPCPRARHHDLLDARPAAGRRGRGRAGRRYRGRPSRVVRAGDAAAAAAPDVAQRRRRACRTTSSASPTCPPLTRAQLTAAIKAIEAAQRQLSRFVPYGV